MRNVAPSRSLVRRANQWKTIGVLVVAFGAFVLAVGILLYAIDLVVPGNPSFGVYNFLRGLLIFVGGAMILASIAIFVRAFTWRTDNDLAKITADTIAPHLDDRFTIVRNVSNPKIGYVDAVLVGPPGVLIFRILDKEGDWANERDNWLVRKGDTLVPAPFNPTRETLVDMDKMKLFLVQNGLKNPHVLGVVVFTKDERRIKLSAREPVVPISHLNLLLVNLRTIYPASEALDMRDVTKIVKLLHGQ